MKNILIILLMLPILCFSQIKKNPETFNTVAPSLSDNVYSQTGDVSKKFSLAAINSLFGANDCIVLDTLLSAIIDTCSSDTLYASGSQTLVLGLKEAETQALGISGANSVALDIRDADYDPTNELQDLIQLNDTSFVISGTNDTIIISSPEGTDDQIISISNDTVYLEDGGFIVLPAQTVNTDDQVISLINDTIYLEDGGFVVLPESGGSSNWEYPDGDTLEPINKSSIVNVLQFYSKTPFGQLLNGRYDVGGGNYIPALGAQANGYGISAIVGVISLKPYAGDTLLVQAGYARNGTESVGLFITPKTDQTRLTSRRELLIDPHHMTAEYDSTVNETYTNLRTIADTIHRTVEYLNNEITESEFKRIGSNYQHTDNGDIVYVSNSSGGRVMDYTGLNGDLSLKFDNSTDLTIDPLRINWTFPSSKVLQLAPSASQTDDNILVNMPRDSGELITDETLIEANVSGFENDDYFTTIINGTISKTQVSDFIGTIIDTVKDIGWSGKGRDVFNDTIYYDTTATKVINFNTDLGTIDVKEGTLTRTDTSVVHDGSRNATFLLNYSVTYRTTVDSVNVKLALANYLTGSSKWSAIAASGSTQYSIDGSQTRTMSGTHILSLTGAIETGVALYFPGNETGNIIIEESSFTVIEINQ